MSTNVLNQAPFLRTSRVFPQEIVQLTRESSKAYIDIANAVNQRIIGIYPTTRPIITGSRFFLDANRSQQEFRQVYPFGAIAPGTQISIPTNINSLALVSMFYGTCLTAMPDYRSIPYTSINFITDQIGLRFDYANQAIHIFNGSTAPAIVSGLVVLHWLVFQ